jgi:mannose-6-phosphate isomerase-like protein (cupin superfamily)
MENVIQEDFLIDFQFINSPKQINDVRLYQIGKKFCRANANVMPHLHVDWYELTIVLGGKGKIYTNNKTEYVEVSEGDIYLSFPADIHAIESDHVSPLKYSFLSFIIDGEAANRGESRPRLLLARDSFANSMVPFLARHFDILMVNLTGNTDNSHLSALCEEYGCGRVLVVCNRENLITSDCLMRVH